MLTVAEKDAHATLNSYYESAGAIAHAYSRTSFIFLSTVPLTCQNMSFA